jgi:hypothetical protein
MFEKSRFKSRKLLAQAAIAALGLGGGALVGSAVAQADEHHAPPPEAYTACDSKSAGDTCSVTFHEHTMEGTCNQRGSDTRLSCRPNHHPIPQAAFDACSGKKEAEACSVEHDGHTMTGTCEDAPGGSLACRPSGPPPH